MRVAGADIANRGRVGGVNGDTPIGAGLAVSMHLWVVGPSLKTGDWSGGPANGAVSGLPGRVFSSLRLAGAGAGPASGIRSAGQPTIAAIISSVVLLPAVEAPLGEAGRCSQPGLGDGGQNGRLSASGWR
jgi:hypothetical protein